MVKEDFDVERDKFGRIITDKDRERMRPRERSPDGPVNYGNTYGLSVRFLENLGIDCPLHTRVFVANLAYDVSFHFFVLILIVGQLRVFKVYPRGTFIIFKLFRSTRLDERNINNAGKEKRNYGRKRDLYKSERSNWLRSTFGIIKPILVFPDFLE